MSFGIPKWMLKPELIGEKEKQSKENEDKLFKQMGGNEHENELDVEHSDETLVTVLVNEFESSIILLFI